MLVCPLDRIAKKFERGQLSTRAEGKHGNDTIGHARIVALFAGRANRRFDGAIPSGVAV